jgi:hypothetical protein
MAPQSRAGKGVGMEINSDEFNDAVNRALTFDQMFGLLEQLEMSDPLVHRAFVFYRQGFVSKRGLCAMIAIKALSQSKINLDISVKIQNTRPGVFVQHKYIGKHSEPCRPRHLRLFY